MKTFFFTFALLLTGISAFASDTAVEPVGKTQLSEIATAVDLFVDDDPICYSTTIGGQASIGFLSGGASVTISGCGDTAQEALANFQAALQAYREQ